MKEAIHPTAHIVRVDDLQLWVKFMQYIKRQEQTILPHNGKNLVMPSWIFRGQANSSWPIKSSFENKLGLDGDEEFLIARERFSLERFRSLTAGYLHQSSDVEMLMVMQHYGVPTRLVDFTSAPLLALYFALEDEHETGDFSVWANETDTRGSAFEKSVEDDVLRKYIKGDQSVVEEKLPTGRTLLSCRQLDYTHETSVRSSVFERKLVEQMYANDQSCFPYEGILRYEPLNPNPRMKAQRGLFLLSTKLRNPFMDSLHKWLYLGEDGFQGEVPLLEIFDGVMGKDRISLAHAFHFIFSKDLREDARLLLTTANITPSTVYPDIGGAAKELCKMLENFK